MLADFPALETLARNRFLQKKFLETCGIPTAEFRLARNHRELVVAHKALGFPGVLKLQFAGAPGEGPWVVRDFEDVPRALVQTRGRALLWERFVAIDREFALVAERAADGPVRIEPEIDERARDYAATIGDRLGIVGTYGVTFFASGDRLLVNEVVVG